MKKFLAAILAILFSLALLGGCGTGNKDEGATPPPAEDTPSGDELTPPEGEQNPSDGEDNPPEEETLTDELKTNLSADGYVKGKISDFSVYEGTDAYRKVKTADEFLKAIVDAKDHYKNVWDSDKGTYSQIPDEGYTEENFEGTVHVIEIENDLNLGFKKLSNTYGIVSSFGSENSSLSHSEMFKENGISQIKIENTSNLLIYSKNGAKLTHASFKLTSDTDVVFRNLQFDEMWQWEDAHEPTEDGTLADNIGDYDWYGWAYFKISFCGYIWIDHCTFGKSYDGQIDISNPVYDANKDVSIRAPYKADGGNGVHISWCNFNSGSDDKDGYLYKMMEAIEENYQAGGTDYLYHNALREAGASFEDILYGVAIPQKKGFLCGDGSAKEYDYNLKLQVSFANCKFTNLEDRIPKLRGGNAYMYNCVVDSSQYYGYRTTLRSLKAANAVSAVKSNWKCALVSQGIVCGNGGSVMAEHCIFRGIETILKNNDSGNGTSGSSNGGYKIENCIYQKTEGKNTSISNSVSTTLKASFFSWHTEDGTQPFTTASYGLDNLEKILANDKYGSGATGDYLNLLKCSV